MTNFLAELADILEDVSTLKKPMAVLVLIVFFLPMMLFAGLIEIMDWMLQWTLTGLANTVGLIITSGLMVACQYIFLRELTTNIVLALLFLVGFVLMLLRLVVIDIPRVRAH